KVGLDRGDIVQVTARSYYGSLCHKRRDRGGQNGLEWTNDRVRVSIQALHLNPVGLRFVGRRENCGEGDGQNSSIRLCFRAPLNLSQLRPLSSKEGAKSAHRVTATFWRPFSLFFVSEPEPKRVSLWEANPETEQS